MEFSDYATYLRTGSERECVRSAVIIIISRLIIVIGGDAARRSLSPTDNRCARPDIAAFDSRAVLVTIVVIVAGQEVVPFVLFCVPTTWLPDCSHWIV